MKTELLKKLACLTLAGVMALSMAACSSDSDKDDEDDSSRTEDVFVPSTNANDDDDDKDESSITDDSKEDESSEADDTDDNNDDDNDDVSYLETDFFKFRVRDAYLTYSAGDYIPNDPAYTHLAVDVEAISTYVTEDIPMGTYDYIIRWGDGEDDWDYALSDEFTEGQYPVDTYISYGETIEGYVYFIVPADEEVFTIEYLTIYEDDSTGETFSIKIPNPPVKETREEYEAENPDSMQHDDDGYVVGESFTFQITDAKFEESVSDIAIEDKVFLCAYLEVENTTDADVVYDTYDVYVEWGDGDDEWEYSVYEEFADDQFPLAATIKPGEVAQGYVYFVVPAEVKDMTTFCYNYLTFDANEEVDEYYYTYFNVQ